MFKSHLHKWNEKYVDDKRYRQCEQCGVIQVHLRKKNYEGYVWKITSLKEFPKSYEEKKKEEEAAKEKEVMRYLTNKTIDQIYELYFSGEVSYYHMCDELQMEINTWEYDNPRRAEDIRNKVRKEKQENRQMFLFEKYNIRF